MADPCGSLAVSGNGAAVSLANVIHDGPNGAGSLALSGGANLTLSGANTYSGGTRVTGGSTLVAANTSGSVPNRVLGTGAVTLDNGTLSVQSNPTAVNQNLANDFVIGAGGGRLAGSAGLDGRITGTGGLTVTGYTVLNGNNSGFAGDLIVKGQGTLLGAGLNTTNAFSSASDLRIGAGAGVFLGSSQTVASLADEPDGAGVRTVSTADVPGFVTLTLAGSGDTTFSGRFFDRGDPNENIGLTLGAGFTGR